MTYSGRFIAFSAFWTLSCFLLFGVSVLHGLALLTWGFALAGGLLASAALTLFAAAYRSRALRQLGLCAHFSTVFGCTAWAAVRDQSFLTPSLWALLLLSALIGAMASEVGLEWDESARRNAQLWAETKRNNEELAAQERRVSPKPRFVTREPSSYDSGVFSVQ